METAHSSLYLGDWRDHWWDEPTLHFWLDRAGLAAATRIADLGCGHGHFGTLIWRLLGDTRTMHFLDREESWIQKLRVRTDAMLADGVLRGRYEAEVGDVDALPYADGSLDLVMAQTLLIHLEQPARALSEMFRVLRPGGFLLLSEPNNLGNTGASLAPDARVDPDAALREMRFAMLCEAGKAKLGLGFNSLSEELPGLIVQAGFHNLVAHQNNRPSLLVPPYEEPAMRAEVELMRSFAARGIACWPREEARVYFEAAGGTGFDAEYDFLLERERERLARVEAGTFARTRAAVHHLFIARRPE
jgi:SAM-dependent methyltransferase